MPRRVLPDYNGIMQEDTVRPQRVLDLRNHPLVRIPGPPIDLTNEQIYELIELP
jgi:hypothetical protein